MGENIGKDNKASGWSHWFEIPAENFGRAVKFYSEIFDIEIQQNDFGNFKMGLFPHHDSGAAICKGEGWTPGSNGPVVYINANPDLSKVLDKIESAGGSIIQPKKHISPEHGYMALFTDSEGNKLALHSMG